MAEHEFITSKFSLDYIMNGISRMPGGFFIYEADYSKEQILYANLALLKLFECETPEQFMELTGGSFRGIVYPDDYERVEKDIKAQIESNESKFDQVSYRIKTKNGQIKYIEDFGSYVEDPDKGPLFYVFVSDPQDYIDSVTGLINRKVFFGNAENRFRKAGNLKKPVMIAFDLNGMSRFNDRYGFREGDRLLFAFGELLQEYFSHDLCSRFGEDHFCAYYEEGGPEEVLINLLNDFRESNSGNVLPVKVGICGCDKDMSLYEIYERARLACQSQKSFYGSSIGYYDEAMARDFSKNEYILRNLDKALSEGWIKVYLQPVIRSLNGKICSAEALSRWLDPEMGVISPGEFIPLLERTGLAYKLDSYMVNSVAKLIRRTIDEGREPVPISVNISRNDFLYCDPVDVVVKALEKNAIKDRSLICVEITESAFADQSDAIKDAIDRFRFEDIEVWMDDFGSGYSSLNVLKDFNFDEIKIDMGFLRNFGEKSKIIITKTVQMAKELNIHTLAEGVETEEQVEFLKNIGCEKIQGFYYAKPMEYDEQMAHLKKAGFEFEDKETASVYEMTGLVNLATTRSRALFFYRKGQFKPVYLNEKYNRTISRAGMTNDQVIEKNMNSPSYLVSRKFRELADKAVKSKETEIMTFVVRNNYFNFSFKDVADSREGSMLLASIDRTSFVEQEKSRELDDVFRNIGSVYDSIYLVDLEEDTRTVITSNLKREKVGDKVRGLKRFYSKYNAREIYPEDLERWQNSVKDGRFNLIFSGTRKGVFSSAVRMKNSEGNYSWIDFTVMYLPESDGKRFLVCVRPSVLEFQQDLADMMKPWGSLDDESVRMDINLKRALMRESGLKLFWKDRDRRFLGVSDEFLKYFGFESVNEVLGHTDEEMKWHVNDIDFMEDELRVLKKGETVKETIGRNIINGVVHNIIATKFPVYDNGTIIGLMGFFFDLDEDIILNESLNNGVLLDPVTGMMNFNGQTTNLIELYDNYLKHNESFIFVSFEIINFMDIVGDFGKEVGEDLVRYTAIRLLNSFGKNAVISRVYGAVFGVAIKTDDIEKVIRSAEKCVSDLKASKGMDNRRFAIRAHFGISLSSERDSVEGLTDLARQRLRGEVPPL